MSPENVNRGLAGLRLLSLDSRRADQMARLIENHGGVGLVAPSMKHRCAADRQRQSNPQSDGGGTRTGLGEAVRHELQHALVVSIGPISTEALWAYGIAPDIEPIHPKVGQLIFETAERAKVLLTEKRAQFG
jgi:uroporphyrinogen-III synthase